MGNLCEKYEFLNRHLVEIKQYMANSHLHNINNNNNSSVVINADQNNTKDNETNTNNNSVTTTKRGTNWDKYFNSSELELYDQLYCNEKFDIPKIHEFKYKKADLIGEGAFGRVYQGFDEYHGKFLAIKEVDLNKYKGKQIDKIEHHVKCLEKEVNILSSLKHKNIVKYYGTKMSGNTIHIVLEYCAGGSIAKLLETYKRLPENVIRKYTTQILEGLEYLHSHNIIHRDLKSANILVDNNGVCKLTDFGGSKVINEELEFLQKNSFKGTPNWMAPETVKNLEYTRFSDIWSLGCTIIEMITGEPPWLDNKDYLSTLYKILHSSKPPEFPKNISDNLNSFLDHCFQMNPTHRLNVTKLLKHPFIIGGNLIQYENDLKELKLQQQNQQNALNTTIKSHIIDCAISELNKEKKDSPKEKNFTEKCDKTEKTEKNDTSTVLNLGDFMSYRRQSDDSIFNNSNDITLKNDKIDKKRIINKFNRDNKDSKDINDNVQTKHKHNNSNEIKRIEKPIIKVSTKHLKKIDYDMKDIIEEERNNHDEPIKNKKDEEELKCKNEDD